MSDGLPGTAVTTPAPALDAFLEQLDRDVHALREHYRGLLHAAPLPVAAPNGADGSGTAAAADVGGLDVQLHSQKLVAAARDLLRLVGQVRYHKALRA